VDLTIEDDFGDELIVDAIYKRLSNDSDIDLLLGPYSSRLSLPAAIQASTVPKFIMLSGAASPTFFKPGSEQVLGFDQFTTNVLAPYYFHDALDIAKNRSAQSVAFVHDDDVLFAGAMCDGAVEYARSIGLHVLESRVKDEQIVEQVNHLKALGADVLVGCGGFDKVVDIVVSARALGYNPDGIILPFAASDNFLATVGAPNGNYILSPAPWVPVIDQDCTLFGSTGKFAQEYRATWGEEPLYQSAEAAAGILAMLAAVEHAGSASTPAVTGSMLELDLPTFYGRLSFFANGTRRDAPMYTEQVLPRNFTRSRFELVGSPALRPAAVWPMPSWREKELQVYPCGEGQVVNVSLGESGATMYACQSCERGMYRDPHSVTCEQCSQGSYGDSTGMTAHTAPLACGQGSRTPPPATTSCPRVRS
jgi:ABC-type branched-subunit amino acid transport system substrate-binding protein